jgi:mercuric ion transport protein
MERATTTPHQVARGWTIASSLGAIVSAFLASVCCVGPLVFALLGVGGAGLLLKLEPYRPYLIALTVAVLAAGFYVTYRRPKVPAAATGGLDCACEHPNANRFGRALLWVATAVVAAFLAFPYVAPLMFG